MQGLKKDTNFVVLLMIVNTVMQVVNSSTAVNGVKYLYLFLLFVTAITSVAVYKKGLNDLKTQYGVIVYATTFLIITVILSVINLINIYDTAYGIIWGLTIYSYLLCLSNPILSMITMFIVQALTVIVQVLNGVALKESLNSVLMIMILSIIRLIIAKISIKDKKTLKEQLLMTREPLKIHTWVQVVVWSMIITCIVYIAKNQMAEVMNSNDVKFMIMGATSVTITTFMAMAAITTSVLIIEVFAVYVLSELYVLTYIIFIQSDNLLEITTVLLDLVILIYMIAKYKGLKNKES